MSVRALSVSSISGIILNASNSATIDHCQSVKRTLACILNSSFMWKLATESRYSFKNQSKIRLNESHNDI